MILMVKFFSYKTYQNANNIFDTQFLYTASINDYPINFNKSDDAFFLSSHYDESSQLQTLNDINDFYIIDVCVEQQICFESYNDMIKFDIPREIFD